MIKKSCSNCANLNCFARGKCEYCSNWRENTQDEAAKKPHREPDVFPPTELLEALAEQHNTRLILSPRCSGKKFLLSICYWLSQFEKMEKDAAEVDRLARFRSQVCQFLGIGGEVDDEAVLEVLKATVHCSWKPAKINSDSAGAWLKARINGDDYFKCPECGVYVEKTFFANDYAVDYCPTCGTPLERKD